jgi:hypothetical protein
MGGSQCCAILPLSIIASSFGHTYDTFLPLVLRSTFQALGLWAGGDWKPNPAVGQKLLAQKAVH